MNLKPSKETMKNLDIWSLRIGRGSVLAILGWIAVTFYNTQIEVARISQELLVIRPADVLEAVHDVESRILNEDDMKRVVRDCSPWGNVERDWIQWRFELEGRIKLQTEILSQTVQNLKSLDHSKIDDRDFERWVSELRERNPDLAVPQKANN